MATARHRRWRYNRRSALAAATIGADRYGYAYDSIGNRLWSVANAMTNSYTANCLNQYTEFTHDADGTMTQCGDWTYTYDAANRLKTASSNGVLIVTNFYDAKSRRVKKVTQEATMTFFYDGWNLVEERIAYTNGTTTKIHYFWGKDLSGTLHGAGGVGGLLYLTIDGVPYIPNYDNIGNIMCYLDANGNSVAQYTYDAFGGTLSQSGSLASFFRHRFSTKYYDADSNLYYYDYRFYLSSISRWLNRDPIEENGGANLYCFVANSPLAKVDPFGQKRLSLSYDFALNTPEYERRTNWSTLSEISIAEAEQDIRDQVGRYSPKGEGKCNCVESITFAGHGSEGVIYLGNAGDNMLAGSTFRTTQSKNFPHEIFSLLSTVRSLACDRMTLRFATCLSGKGVAGKDLQDELDKFFGDNVSVILYGREVGFIFNHVIPRLF